MCNKSPGPPGSCGTRTVQGRQEVAATLRSAAPVYSWRGVCQAGSGGRLGGGGRAAAWLCRGWPGSPGLHALRLSADFSGVCSRSWSADLGERLSLPYPRLAAPPPPHPHPGPKGAAPRWPGQGARGWDCQFSWTRRAPSGQCPCRVSPWDGPMAGAGGGGGRGVLGRCPDSQGRGRDGGADAEQGLGEGSTSWLQGHRGACVERSTAQGTDGMSPGAGIMASV